MYYYYTLDMFTDFDFLYSYTIIVKSLNGDKTPTRKAVNRSDSFKGTASQEA